MTFRNFKKLTVTAVTATAVLGTAQAASAATLMSMDSIGYDSETGISTAQLDNEALSVEKFDSSLGQLNSISVDFMGDVWNTTMGEVSELDEGETLEVELDGDLELKQDSDQNDPLTTIPLNITHTLEEKGDFELSDSASGGVQYSVPEDSFASFIGDGNVKFFADANFSTMLSGSGNLLFGTDTSAAAKVKVTYDYEEETADVPEPGMMAGLSILGLGWLVRKRRTA